MTFTSSPGMSLMLEGISYMVGAEMPGVIVDVMRGGPGLGNIAPEQADIKLLVPRAGPRQQPRHGSGPLNTPGDARSDHAGLRPLLRVPESGGDRRRWVSGPDDREGSASRDQMVEPGLPEWAVWGDEMHRRNLISSIFLNETDLENHNIHINAEIPTDEGSSAAGRYFWLR